MTHQNKAVSEQIKARIFAHISLRSLLWLEIGHNLLTSFLSYTGGSSIMSKVMPIYPNDVIFILKPFSNYV